MMTTIAVNEKKQQYIVIAVITNNATVDGDIKTITIVMTMTALEKIAGKLIV